MDFPAHLTPQQVHDLKYEVTSAEARARITRLLRPRQTSGQDWPIERYNNVINRARTVAALSPYVLEADDWGQYQMAEYAWHQGEFEACIRRLETAQLIDFLAESVQDGFVELTAANQLLEQFNSSARLTSNSDDVRVQIITTDEIADLHEQMGVELHEVAHPNIRTLVDRMDRALKDADYPAVLHASASILETLAKETIASPKVENETLGGFFAKFQKLSGLPQPVLTWILDIYNRRNKEPLAGHGHLAEPTVTSAEATTLCDMTKAFVVIEKKYQLLQLSDPASAKGKAPTTVS